MVIPANIPLIHILQYTLGMNTIEQVWREVCTGGFRNEAFHAFEKVIDCLCCMLKSMTLPEHSQHNRAGLDFIFVLKGE